jgi:hypothetical protein
MSQFFHGLHYSPDISPIEHVWDALDQLVLIPINIQHLHIAIEEEWDNIPQATINSLINSMRRGCVAVTPDTDCFLIHAPTYFFKGICDQQMQICIPSHVKSHRLGHVFLISLYEL